MTYYKIINGLQTTFQGNVLYTEDSTIINPTHEQMLEAGWLILEDPYEEVDPEIDQYIIIDELKQEKLQQIDEYDKSSDVNLFYLAGQPMWLDAQTRQTLRTSIDSYISMGIPTVTKWFEGQSFTFPTQAWIQMLNALEVYAAEALNVTEAHRAAIMNMDNIEDVQEYDITEGYPEKLDLSVDFLKSM